MSEPVPKTAREQLVETMARADSNSGRQYEDMLDAALSEPLTQVCATCGGTGRVPMPAWKAGDWLGQIDPCPDCTNGTTTSGPAIIQALVDEGMLVPILVDNDDGAGGQWIDADGKWQSYARPSTKRVVGYRVPVSKEGTEAR